MKRIEIRCVLLPAFLQQGRHPGFNTGFKYQLVFIGYHFKKAFALKDYFSFQAQAKAFFARHRRHNQ